MCFWEDGVGDLMDWMCKRKMNKDRGRWRWEKKEMKNRKYVRKGRKKNMKKKRNRKRCE